MVQGIKIHVTVEELKAHLMEKSDYHVKKADFYQDKVVAMEESDAASDPTLFNASNNPVGGFKESVKKHKAKSEYFKYLADHLVPGETYELSDGDLRTLEIVSYYF